MLRLDSKKACRLLVAVLAVAFAGCRVRPSTEVESAGTEVPQTQVRTEEPRVSMSFAEALLATDAEVQEARSALIAHPALDALLRHQRMSGNADADRETVLNGLLTDRSDPAGARRVLDAWRGREGALLAAADESKALLPDGSGFDGRIDFVVGYDIAVAAPPDIIVNAGHPHFVADPEEVGHYVVHEAHHVGFLAVRVMPKLSELQEPDNLRALIRFMTQMEGMAVHAAFEARRDAGALDADADYRVYRDEAFVRDVVARYRQEWNALEGSATLTDAEVGETLNAMSSGERLWYRFGAVVAHRMEQDLGRPALVDSISQPAKFWDAAQRVLATTDAREHSVANRRGEVGQRRPAIE